MTDEVSRWKFEVGQEVYRRSTGAKAIVRQVRASGVVVVVEADGKTFGVVDVELTEVPPLRSAQPIIT